MALKPAFFIAVIIAFVVTGLLHPVSIWVTVGFAPSHVKWVASSVLPKFQPMFILATNCVAVMSLNGCGVGGVPPPVTVTVAVPLLAASTVDVALTVSDVRASAAATVSKPPALMVVPAFLPA